MSRQRTRINIPTLLNHLGVHATKRGKLWVAKCPNPKHADSDPSWRITDDLGSDKHGSHHCFSCKFGGGPWELAAAVWGCTATEAGERLRKLFPNERYAPKEAPRVRIVHPGKRKAFELPKGVVIPGAGGKWFAPALDYLRSRDVTDEQIDKWSIGYALRGKLARRVVIPVYDRRGRLLSYSARALSRGMVRYDSGHKRDGANPDAALWGEQHFEGVEIVTVAEGVFSGLALERAGAPNPCAGLGSQLTEGRALKLARFRCVLIATDPDAAGDAYAEKLAIFGRRSQIVRVRLENSPDDEDPEVLRAAVAEALSDFA